MIPDVTKIIIIIIIIGTISSLKPATHISIN